MSGFAIDTGSDYSSGGEVGAGTPDVEEEYDDGGSSSGGSSGGGSVSTGGGTVVPESGVTPEENTGTIDLGETGDVEDTLYDDPQSAHESDLYNPDGGPSAGARIPDADTFPQVDDGFSSGFWDLVIDSEGNVIDDESGGVGDVLEDLEGNAPLDEGYQPVPQPDYSGNGEPGGQLTDRLPVEEPDWDGDGNPGGNLTDRNISFPSINIPEFNVPDPEINLDLGNLTTSVIAGVVVLGLGYMFTSQGSSS